MKLFTTLVFQRAKSIPLQYLTNQVGFWGYPFFVKKGVFIPRPETEILVEETINLQNKYFGSSYVSILDIGTGCGNICVSLAKSIEKSRIVATDISLKALKTALFNAKSLGVDKKIRFFKRNLFPEQKDKFHIIVSNPPYIPDVDIPSLAKEVTREPLRALKGGLNGMEVVEIIIHKSYEYLVDGGYLILEIGYGQANLIRDIKTCMRLVTIKQDLAGIERYPIFRKDI
jgi:release factor glutamine methyltransferase